MDPNQNDPSYQPPLQQQSLTFSSTSNLPALTTLLSSTSSASQPFPLADSRSRSVPSHNNMRAQAGLRQGPVPIRPRPSYPLRRMLSEREQFVVFVKILFKCIEQSDDQNLRLKAKAIVNECTRRNRMGDSNYTPLQDAVERRLKKIVGELYWARAKLSFDHYCRSKGLRSLAAV